jgi:hypothetical protein
MHLASAPLSVTGIPEWPRPELQPRSDCDIPTCDVIVVPPNGLPLSGRFSAVRSAGGLDSPHFDRFKLFPGDLHAVGPSPLYSHCERP